MKSVWDVIKGPLVTEKALKMKDEPDSFGREANKKGQILVFKVATRATKPEIKAAVEKILGVKVEAVRVANFRGKQKRWGMRRQMGRRPDWKKAYITIKGGEKQVQYDDIV
jgi:large subunit ribosomal protein L23